jgi:16S rRNA (adenine1518-N6/adenine1519-N6)-dimethyltransferase
LRQPGDKKPHVARRRFGQHFLHERRVVERLLKEIDPGKNDLIVEIGPGEGALTGPLLEHLDRLQVVEIDRDLAAELETRYPREKLTVHCADALEFDFAQFPAGMRIVGNLPYNISTPLLFHLARFAERVRDMHFMLQLEVVERMVAAHSTPEYGRLSVMLQTRFRMKKLFNVAPGAFRPPPKVDSAVVRLVPVGEKPACDPALLEKIVRQAFSARRKTLRNALPLAPQDFEALRIEPKLRPENLSPADYVRIADYLASNPR